MFKKFASIAIAALLVGSTAVVASAAEADDDAVAAADDNSSAVAAADDASSAVGADDASEATGASTKIFFDVKTTPWNVSNAQPAFYLYEHGAGEIITWGSKKGKMTAEGDGVFSYDLGAKGITLESGKAYGCIFTDNWNAQTCDLILGADSVGDTAVCTANKIENNVDSNKKSLAVKWKSGKYGNPKCITSIGNVIGDTLWPGDSDYGMFLAFLKSDGKDGLANALKFNGKDEQTTVDDTAKALGLGKEDVKKAIAESGKTIKWDESKSSLSGGSSGGGSSSGGSSSGGGSESGGSTSGGSSSGSSSVTSGQDSTIHFVLGGVMLAAVGVFFLARKKREY